MSISGVLTRGYGGTGHRADGTVRRGYAAYTGLPEPPATGYEYETSTTLYSGSGYSLEQGSSPAVLIGDVFITQTTSAPGGYTIDVFGDGTVELLAGGDSSRQSFLYEIYRVASNSIDGPATVWINEIGPIWSLGPLPKLTIGAPVSFSFANLIYVYSPSGDTLSFALNSGSLPTGLTLNMNGTVSGTPTTAGTYTFTVAATDYASITTVSPSIQFQVSSSSIPVVSVIPSVGVSAWTADSGIVTADSINFTCDGADLINGGGTPEIEKGGPAKNVSQYLRF